MSHSSHQSPRGKRKSQAEFDSGSGGWQSSASANKRRGLTMMPFSSPLSSGRKRKSQGKFASGSDGRQSPASGNRFRRLTMTSRSPPRSPRGKRKSRVEIESSSDLRQSPASGNKSRGPQADQYLPPPDRVRFDKLKIKLLDELRGPWLKKLKEWLREQLDTEPKQWYGEDDVEIGFEEESTINSTSLWR